MYKKLCQKKNGENNFKMHFWPIIEFVTLMW
jgi:hypothetical protein